jgi:O-antigen ligase
MGEYTRYQGLIPGIGFAVMAVVLTIGLRRGTVSLVHVLSWSGSAVAVYALIQMFGFDPFTWSYTDNAASTVGHSNFAGAVMAMCLPATLVLWYGTGSRILYAVATIVSVLAIIGTFSQGAWGAALAGAAVTVGVLVRGRHRWAPILGLGCAGLIGLVNLAVVLASQIQGSPLFGSSTWARGLSWRTAFDIGMDHPLFGAGPNAFAYEASRYRSATEALFLERANDPHSLPLSWFADLGFLGVIGFVVIVWWVVVRASRALDASGAAFAGGAMAFVAVSVVTVNEVSARAVFWACVAGLAASSAPFWDRDRRSTSRWTLVPGVAMATAASVALCVVGVGTISADLAFARAAGSLAESRIDDAGTTLASLSALPGNHLHQRQILGQLAGEAALRTDPYRDSYWRFARSAHSVIEPFPYVRYVGSSAYWLTQRSAFDPESITDALALWRQAILLDPYDPDPHVYLAALLVRLNQVETAVASLQRYVGDIEAAGETLRGVDASQVRGMLAIAYLRRDEVALAEEALSHASISTSASCMTLLATELISTPSARQDEVELEDLPVETRIQCDAASLALVSNL